jgi:hypothetical protein
MANRVTHWIISVQAICQILWNMIHAESFAMLMGMEVYKRHILYFPFTIFFGLFALCMMEEIVAFATVFIAVHICFCHFAGF